MKNSVTISTLPRDFMGVMGIVTVQSRSLT